MNSIHYLRIHSSESTTKPEEEFDAMERKNKVVKVKCQKRSISPGRPVVRRGKFELIASSDIEFINFALNYKNRTFYLNYFYNKNTAIKIIKIFGIFYIYEIIKKIATKNLQNENPNYISVYNVINL